MKHWLVIIEWRVTGVEGFIVTHPTKPTEHEVLTYIGAVGAFNPDEEFINVFEWSLNEIGKI